jgi:hypothetical protein
MASNKAKSGNNNGKSNYRALRIVSSIYMIGGFLVLFGTIIIGGMTLLSTSTFTSFDGTSYTTGGLTVALPILFGGLMSALALFAVGQLIQVVLEMVENSRRQTSLLEFIARSNRE